jgi:hypothetical protein
MKFMKCEQRLLEGFCHLGYSTVQATYGYHVGSGSTYRKENGGGKEEPF